jgi:hypothetical protein
MTIGSFLIRLDFGIGLRVVVKEVVAVGGLSGFGLTFGARAGLEVEGTSTVGDFPEAV